MANERVVLCGGASESKLPARAPVLRLRRWGSDANVCLVVEDVRRPLFGPVPRLFLDLLDLAAYVYAADQAVPRGDSHDAGYGASWRRRLFFRVAVREKDFWGGPEARRRLVALLSFLTEDEYHFEFEPLRSAPPAQDYFALVEGKAGRPEEVVLFSGGLDSLAGAVEEAVVSKRRVALVHHRSHEKLAPRVNDLAARLQAKAPAAPPVYVPVRVNKDEALGREPTQRSRSFLFAALGASLAAMLGLDRVRAFENGPLSVNLPLSGQVVGARASRTTHPLTLARLGDLLSHVAGRPFRVENPFRWETKAEVVGRVAQAGCAELIGLTVSCAHPREAARQQPHCGRCSQCIDRRFAVLAAGQEDHDPRGGYKVDLLTGARAEGHPRTMLSAYVEAASLVTRLDEAGFFARFGEATRALCHSDVPPEVAGPRLVEMYRRHARSVIGVVGEALVRYRDAIVARDLPPSCLVALVCDQGSGAGPRGDEAAPPAPEPGNVFRRRGSAWEVRFRGRQSFLIRDGKGAAYLHLLLAAPGRPASAAELACAVAREPARFALGAGEVVDREALAAYRARYEEVTGLLEEARAGGDLAAQEKYQVEAGHLLAAVRAATGLGGKPRRVPDDRQRARRAVQGAISRAVREIGKYDEVLADHLSPPRLCCGNTLRYDPGEDLGWETDGG